MARWTYYHDLSPFILQITDSLGLRWYSLAYIMGAVGAYFLGRYYIVRGRLDIPGRQLVDIVTYGAIGAIVGGRLGYCLFYGPYLLLDFDSSFPFWGVLKIHEGGMASHGGIAGLFVSLGLFSKFKKVSFFSLIDLSALAGTFGVFLGRIANFINGELWGNIIQRKALLGVKFPSELSVWSHYGDRYKEQLISLKKALPALGDFQGLQNALPDAFTWENWVQQALSDTYYRQKVSLIVRQLYEASQSHYEPVKAALASVLPLRHPSQLYQSFCGGFLTFLIICLVWLKPRKPGLVSFIAAICYLSFRVVTEMFRMPDAFLGYRIGGLTQGQLLSLCGFLLALTYGFFVWRSGKKGFVRHP